MGLSENEHAILLSNQRRASVRRAAKVDRNQAEIVKAFRQIGASVQDLSAVGKGCPDLLVGFRGQNVMVEVKDGLLTPGNRLLTADQEHWHASWAGQVAVVKSIEEAVALVATIGCKS